MAKHVPYQGKHRDFAKIQGILFCSSCTFPDSKDRVLQNMPPNFRNWHRVNLPLDRENTGNLKIRFEWGPCHSSLIDFYPGIVQLSFSRFSTYLLE